MGDDVPSLRQHIQIARYAATNGWVASERAISLIAEISQRYAGRDVPLEQWVVEGILDERQLDEALEGNGPSSDALLPEDLEPPAAADPDTIPMHLDGLSSAKTQALDDDDSVATLMTLPTAVIERQQHQRHSFDREPTTVRDAAKTKTDEMLALEHADQIGARVDLEAPLGLIAISEASSAPTAAQLLADTATSGEFYTPGVPPEQVPQERDEVPAVDDAPTKATSPADKDPFAQRYVLGRTLGQGGGGRVIRAYDRVLGRCVAMKILRTGNPRQSEQLARFITEAQTTGQLEHPNIVPIYDFGTLATGEVYYTMREVRNTSLREVLRGLKHGQDREIVEEYTLLRLVSLLRQVCLAIHYAHVRGVVHRDLKPDNIMLGDYGEVLLMDWGLARIFDETSLSIEDNLQEKGQTMGTPAYMPPEQARGELHAIDARSDVYSLGAILYEILTLEAPYSADNPITVMWKVVEGDVEPPSKRAPHRDVPDELERICLRAIAHRKETRYPSAKALHDALEDWLEGVQPREAQRRVIDGKAWFKRYRMLNKESEALGHRVCQEAGCVEDWEPLESKRALWELEDRLERIDLETARAFGHAVANFTQALAYQPGLDEARRGLADLYWARFEQAEREQDMVNAIYFKALVAQYDDDKRYDELFKEQVSLHIETNPAGAHLSLSLFREVDRHLVTRDKRDLGHAPFVDEAVSTGSYLLEVRYEQCSHVICHPLYLRRGEEHHVRIDVPDASRWREGFVYIPQGDFLVGGDPEAFDPRPLQTRTTDAFFCAVHPITFREYLAFIDDVHAHDPDRAKELAPQLRGSEGMLAHFDEEQGRWVPDEILIEGPARAHYPAGQGYEFELPVVGVCVTDALAYIAWRSDQDGIRYRLPTEDEMEKAARGVDGRVFPWGNRFDATFCKMRFSREELPQLEPVGTFDYDISPYGVRDLAGGVQEWCADNDDDPVDCPVKGGGWNQDERACHIASRIRILSVSRTAGLGFRLVYDAHE